MHLRLLLACTSLSFGACTGPATHLHGADDHRVFVDGVAVGPAVPAEDGRTIVDPIVDPDERYVPFRYYGVARWTAFPADDEAGRPDWFQLPTSGTIEKPAPASPWLFPLDFPLELLHRVVAGRGDQHVQVELASTPADWIGPVDVPPTGLPELLQRATAARVAR